MSATAVREPSSVPSGRRSRKWEYVGAASIFLLLVGCNDDVTRVEFEAVQKEADGLRTQVEELRERSAAELDELGEQLDESDGERVRLEGEVEVLKQQLEDSSKELEFLKQEYGDYQRKYRVSVRENAKGRKFEKLVVSGEVEEVFTGVTVTELNPARLRVMHSSGATSIPLVSLSSELQAELGFHLEEATAFLEEEAQNSKPKVLPQEEKNQWIRDEFARKRMEDQTKWKKSYAEAERIEKQMASVNARLKAVVNALNRRYTGYRRPTGAGLADANSLKKQRAELDKQYQRLKMRRAELLNR